MPIALINRNAYDFQSIETELKLNGRSFDTFGLVEGLEKFDYSCKINHTTFYGRGQFPLKMTEGDAEFSASITIARYWFDYICDRVAELEVGLMDLEMTMTLHYIGSLPGQGPPRDHVDTLTDVRFAGINAMGEHGPSQLMVEMPLDLMNIYWNGRDLKGRTRK